MNLNPIIRLTVINCLMVLYVSRVIWSTYRVFLLFASLAVRLRDHVYCCVPAGASVCSAEQYRRSQGGRHQLRVPVPSARRDPCRRHWGLVPNPGGRHQSIRDRQRVRLGLHLGIHPKAGVPVQVFAWPRRRWISGGISRQQSSVHDHCLYQWNGAWHSARRPKSVGQYREPDEVQVKLEQCVAGRNWSQAGAAWSLIWNYFELPLSVVNHHRQFDHKCRPERPQIDTGDTK